MLKANVARVGVNEKTNTPVIILLVEDDKGMLPIAVGKREAKAIALALQDVQLPRPISYDLMKNILGRIDVFMERVRITALREGTFYAEIDLIHNGQKLTVDSRPSDAIALALRMDAPIYIEDNVVKQAVVQEARLEPETSETQNQPNIDEERRKFREFLEKVKPEDFGDPEELE